MNLYWLSTPDNYENWFAFAKSQKKAEIFHELAEGFDENYAKANLVCEIPKELIVKYGLQKLKSDWPTHEMIIELGGKIISEDNPRIVNFFGKVYIEGTCTEGIFLMKLKKLLEFMLLKYKKLNNIKLA